MIKATSAQFAEQTLPMIIFGVGSVGEALFHAAQEQGIKIEAFCDNNANFVSERRCGLEIVHAPALRERYPDAQFLISCADIADIAKQLAGLGYNTWFPATELLRDFDVYRYTYQRPADFVEHTVTSALMCHDSYMNPDKIFLRCADLIVTEKCSMKCVDCANLAQYYDAPEDDDPIEVIHALDDFFQAVDEVNEIRVIGGEPFMHKQAHLIVERLICEQRLRKVLIYTNATIVPKPAQIAMMTDPKVLFIITNYGELSRNHDKLVTVLKENGIAYVSTPPYNWTDCGKIAKHNRTEDEQKYIFGSCCVKNTFNISGGRLYRCPFSANAARLHAIPDFPGDSVKFVGRDVQEVKAEMRKFIYEMDFLRTCDWCNGRTYGNPQITPGIQVKKPLAYERFPILA